MKNKFLLLVAALVLSTTATFATTQVSSSNTPAAVAAPAPRENMEEQVRQYMYAHEILVTYVCQQQGTLNYLAKDCYGIMYIVYTDGTTIIGHDQVDF